MEQRQALTLKELLIKDFKNNKKKYPNIAQIMAYQKASEDASKFSVAEVSKAVRELRAVDDEMEKEEQSKRLGELGDSFDVSVAKFFCATPGASFVYNNKGTGFGPDKVLEHKSVSGPKGHPAGDWQEKLAKQIGAYGNFETAAVQYKQSPAEFTDKLPMLSTSPAFNSTVGSGPAWAFAMPKPALRNVGLAGAEATLNGHAAAAGKALGWFTGKLTPGKGWVMQSTDGTLGGQFVCFHKDGEETAFISDAFILDGVCFRATHAEDSSHAGKWKLLKDYLDYAALCKKYDKTP